MANDGFMDLWSTGVPLYLCQHHGATEAAMRLQIAAARSGGEFMMDELVLTSSQLEAYQQASRELSRVSGKELADIYFKECVK